MKISVLPSNVLNGTIFIFYNNQEKDLNNNQEKDLINNQKSSIY